MLQISELDSFARYCALEYCRRYCGGSRDAFGDAYGITSVYLLKHQRLWTVVSRAELLRRSLLNLIRVYQDEHGLRRKTPTRRATVDDYPPIENWADWRDDLDEVDRRDEARNLVRRAAANAGVEDRLDLLLAIADGATRREVAERFATTVSDVDRIWKSFQYEALKIGDADGVKIDDDDLRFFDPKHRKR